jgi:hypothetical protein
MIHYNASSFYYYAFESVISKMKNIKSMKIEMQPYIPDLHLLPLCIEKLELVFKFNT